MKPASNLDYCDRLLKELNEAPTRSWFKSMVDRWKDSLRFSRGAGCVIISIACIARSMVALLGDLSKCSRKNFA